MAIWLFPLLANLLLGGVAWAAAEDPWEQLRQAPRPAPDPAEDEGEGTNKKAEWLRDKAQQRRHRAALVVVPRAGLRPLPVLTLRNLWTFEVLPVVEGTEPSQKTWDRFLRCHHTNQTTTMDRRLLGLLRVAAQHFDSHYIELVSGYRSPKYNLMLRKKGHQVARDSQHTYGNAIDFRLAGVDLRTLRRFVLSLRMGGVGYYPRSQFVHADTGPLRTWTAE